MGHQKFKGRGAVSNPAVRFEAHSREQTHDGWYEDEIVEHLNETVLPDHARSVISYNDSPDVGFDQSINPYRGCSHGCVYCFARPTHAYLGLSPGLDFETKLFYKADAVKILIYYTPFDEGWAKKNLPNNGPSKEYPPDQPPTDNAGVFPDLNMIPPFHYKNPVTGK